jgi:polyvinyl alcohol dehydrogenase (cytochrome)
MTSLRVLRLGAALPVLAGLLAANLSAQSAGSIYRTRCATCHDGDGTARAPSFVSLRGMSARAILAALTEGTMRDLAADIPAADKRAVAEMVAGRPLDPAKLPEAAFCSNRPAPAPRPSPADWTGWGGSARGTGFRDETQSGLSAREVPELELRWAFGFADGTATRSQPSVVGNQLLVGGQFGEVYSLDAETGCIQWAHQGEASVKGVVAVSGEDGRGRRTAIAADTRTNVTALDIETGQPLWTVRAGDHPAHTITGSPVIHGDRVFVPISSMEVVTGANPAYRCCTSSGAVVALDLASGALVWRHRVIAEEAAAVGTTARGVAIMAPSGAPVWSSPTVDAKRGLLYVGTGENYTRPTTETSDAILALELATGKVAWSFQATAMDAYNLACGGATNGPNCPAPPGPDVDFGQAPLIMTLPNGRDLLVVGQKLGVVYALDPDRMGAVVWQSRIGRGGVLGGVHWGVAAGNGRVFVPISDRITPADPAGPPRPGLHAVDLETGKLLWSRPAPECGKSTGCFEAFSAAPTAIPGVVFSGGLDGVIRAYAAGDGRVLWEFDTVREFATVNGVVGQGGAIDGPGPTVARGMVFVSSGYALFGQLPGNVLLAFGVRR